jgi:hypothetical protein
MRDVYEVLREREQALEQVAREVQALRSAARLLKDDFDAGMTASAAIHVDTGDRSSGDAQIADAVNSGAKKISARLRRFATPLLNTWRAAG